MNYLSQGHLLQALARGRKVEQWLGPAIERGEHLLKWVCIEREPAPGSTYSVVIEEVYDDGEAQLAKLPVLDVDEPEGKISSFDDKEEALEYVINELHGSRERFVQDGEIQEEYEAYLRHRPKGNGSGSIY